MEAILDEHDAWKHETAELYYRRAALAGGLERVRAMLRVMAEAAARGELRGW